MRPPQWFKKLAIPLANRIVYASDAYVGLKSTINEMSGSLIDFTRPPSGPADQRLLEFVRLIRPWIYDGLQLIRVGGNHDGGYVMANDFNVTGAISIGVGNDITWDRDVASRGIPVVMFDPTVRRPPERLANACFIRVGLGPPNSQGPYKTLEELLRLAQMESEKSLLLKIDVEGAEWDAFTGLDPLSLKRFSQIVIELHGLGHLRDVATSDSILRLAETLARNHCPIHLHANNYDGVSLFDSYWFPDALELTYVRKDGAVNLRPARMLDEQLDQPCDPRVAEIPLKALLYLL